MEIAFQNKMQHSQKVFIRELNDSNFNNRDSQVKHSLVLCGTVVKIIKMNENLAIFNIEDLTGSQTIEIFRDKVPVGVLIEIGQKWIIKGEYAYNYFKEKIFKGYKLKLIDINEEYLFYMNIVYNSKQHVDQLKIIEQKSDQANKKYISQDITHNALQSKIFSSLFWFFIDKAYDIQSNNNTITIPQILEIPDIQQIKKNYSVQDSF